MALIYLELCRAMNGPQVLDKVITKLLMRRSILNLFIYFEKLFKHKWITILIGVNSLVPSYW
jgi:hypothetical protein